MRSLRSWAQSQGKCHKVISTMGKSKYPFSASRLLCSYERRSGVACQKQNPFEGSAAGIRRSALFMPAYNTERFVDKALDSLLQQHCQDFEVVL